jgi:YMGG-like Gly-zipper
MKQRQTARIGVSSLLILTVLAYSLYGCESMPRGFGTAIGGVSGGAIGALIGGLAGDEKGALIGAGAGALVGGLVGYAIASRQIKGYQTTKREQGYEPSEGEVVRITDFSVNPTVVSPGTQLAFQATYYIMTPNPDQEVPITEVRILKGFDPQTMQYRELGRTPARQVMIKPGTRQADGKIPIGQDAREGDYRIAFEVERDGTRDQKELPLTITKNRVLLNAPANKIAQVTELPKRPF